VKALWQGGGVKLFAVEVVPDERELGFEIMKHE
jgi:hypothetical protein